MRSLCVCVSSVNYGGTGDKGEKAGWVWGFWVCYMSKEFDCGQSGSLVNLEAQSYETRKIVLRLCEHGSTSRLLRTLREVGGATYLLGRWRKGFAKRCRWRGD